MKIKKPNTGQLAAIGAVAGLLGLTLGGVALADGLSRDDVQGLRPYAEVVADDVRQAVPPPPTPPAPRAPAVWSDEGPRPPRADYRPRGSEQAAGAGWDDDRRGPPPHAAGDRKRDRDARRAARGGQWVWCEYERDGDLDCDEDDGRTWAGADRPTPPAPPVR